MKPLVTAIILILLANTAVAGARPAQFKTFSAAAAFDGPAVQLLKHGPLSLVLRCRQGGPPGADDVAELSASSTTDDWLATTLPQPVVPLPAGAELVVMFAHWAPGTTLAYGGPAPLAQGQTAGVSASAATGQVLTVPADTVAFGTDGATCTVTGAALLHSCQEC
jgi:hypothetical protein